MVANRLMPSPNNIPVYLRIRPQTKDSSLPNEQTTKNSDFEVDFEKKTFRIFKRKSTCSFSNVFDGNIKNNELFKRIGANLVKNVLDGNDSTIFTIGPSNSGKTFSMLGDLRNPGVFVQSIKYMLESIKNQDKECDDQDIKLAKHYFGESLLVASKHDSQIQNKLTRNDNYHANKGKSQKKYFISLNIFELFDDQIFDLLSENSNHNRNSKVISKDILENKYKPRDLTSRYVNDLDEAHYVTFKAVQKRHTENTTYNQVTSKGHIFIYINLHELSVMGFKNKVEINTARMTICDLGGSEKHLGIINDKQEKKKQDTPIAQLERVFSQIFEHNLAIINKLALIKSSKLTRLLFSDFVGNKDHSMSVLATFDPSNSDLNFMCHLFDILNYRRCVPNLTENTKKNAKNKDIKLSKVINNGNYYDSKDRKQQSLLETIETLKKKLVEKDEEIAIVECKSRYEASLEYEQIIMNMEQSNMIIQRKIDKEGIDFTDKKLQVLQNDMNLEMFNLKKDLMEANKNIIHDYEILLKQKDDENKELLKETRLLKRKLKELSFKIPADENCSNVNQMEKPASKRSKLSMEASINIVPSMLKPIKNIQVAYIDN